METNDLFFLKLQFTFHRAAENSYSVILISYYLLKNNFPSLQPPLPGHGQGRLSVLDQPVTVATAIQKMKSHLGLSHLRLALGLGKKLGNEPLYKLS